MNNQFDSPRERNHSQTCWRQPASLSWSKLTTNLAQSVTRQAVKKWVRSVTGSSHRRFTAGALAGWLVILPTLVPQELHAQPIQPEVLFNFPHGNLPHKPEHPYGNLVEGSDGNFYGTTERGGTYHNGTVFKVTTNGVITTVASFDGTNGAQPHAGLTLGPDGDYYGTTWLGGTNSEGTVFKVTTNGVLTLLVTFNVTNGKYPEAGLVLGQDGNLYGTTSRGGINGRGTVFRVTTNGALTTLVSFNGANGADPLGALTLESSGDFYGTTSEGGNGYGTVFKVTTNGNLTTLAHFDGTNGDFCHAALTLGPDGSYYGTTHQGSGGYGTVFKVTTNGVLTRIAAFNGVNGSGPVAPLTLASDGSFYGTTGWGGGTSRYGTIFRVTTNGILTRLVAFNGVNGNEPHSGLTLASDGNLYGTTAFGGVGLLGMGTVFRLRTNGALTSLASFGNSDGRSPGAALTLGKDGDFYGTTLIGGSNGYGMIFRFTTNGILTHLASFDRDSQNGNYPSTALTQGNDGSFYGTTAAGGGGPGGAGTIFRVTTNGILTRLFSFGSSTSPNGAYPGGPLTLGNDGNFYGTARSGGSGGYGTVFKITPGGVFTRLGSFSGTNGATPLGPLALGPDGNFYGTTSSGGSFGGGTVFKVTANGILTSLGSFNSPNGQILHGGLTLGNDGYFYGLAGPVVTINGVGTLLRITTNGSFTPLGSFSYVGGGLLSTLVVGNDGNFYGTTPGGSSENPGTVFQVTPNGTFTTLVAFSNTNGAVPLAPLTLGSDDHFYGTTAGGGSQSEGWEGTIFRINRREPVVINQPKPANQVVKAGVDVTLNAAIFGAPPLSAQWFLNNSEIPGQTNTWLTLDKVTPSMSGTYLLRVTNNLGSTWSSNAVLTVLPALITNRPVAGITASGAIVSGSVTPGDSTTLAWFEWGTDINYGNIAGVTIIPSGSGTTILSAQLGGLIEGVVYHYRIVAWNSFGIVYGPDQTFEVGHAQPWTQTSAPINRWNSVASSADGTKLAAVAWQAADSIPGPIYTSTNSGATWTQTSAPLQFWIGIASSADGNKLVAVVGWYNGGNGIINGPIYTSADSGTTWTQTSAPIRNWSSVASSADGVKLVATDGEGRRIYTSADSGDTWTQTSAPGNYWSSVASSADGTKLVAAAGAYPWRHPPGPIYTSTNSGATWVSNSAPIRYWTGVASSADGATLVATVGGFTASPGPIFVSTNSGAVWTQTTAPTRFWWSVACSADGTKLAATVSGGQIYTSTNSGATWFTNDLPNGNWGPIASSADGASLVASIFYPGTGGIYTTRLTPRPALSLRPLGSNAMVSWVVPSLDFVLKESADLTSPVWMDVPISPVLNLTNLRYEVALPVTNGMSFFRLKH